MQKTRHKYHLGQKVKNLQNGKISFISHIKAPTKFCSKIGSPKVDPDGIISYRLVGELSYVQEHHLELLEDDIS